MNPKIEVPTWLWISLILAMVVFTVSTFALCIVGIKLVCVVVLEKNGEQATPAPKSTITSVLYCEKDGQIIARDESIKESTFCLTGGTLLMEVELYKTNGEVVYAEVTVVNKDVGIGTSTTNSGENEVVTFVYQGKQFTTLTARKVKIVQFRRRT